MVFDKRVVSRIYKKTQLNKTTSASPVFLNEQTLLSRKLSIENTNGQ